MNLLDVFYVFIFREGVTHGQTDIANSTSLVQTIFILI